MRELTKRHLPDKKAKRSSRTVYIGLGGNIGDVETSMCSALRLLDAHPQITLKAKSALYKTPPWGDEDQDWFLNACAELETTLDPHALLIVLKETELALKRKKTHRWGPRTIDLDILFYAEAEVRDATLEIPHPRMKERGFVLLPLMDLSEDKLIEGKPLDYWLGLLDTSGIELSKSPDQW